jgi:hypothetical protein
METEEAKTIALRHALADNPVAADRLGRQAA